MGEENATVMQMKDLIGEAGLADRGWAKEYLDKPLDKTTAAALLKKLDGAESLIGKRPAIPSRDAKPEELEKFFEQFRPDKAEDYEIPMEKDAKPDPDFLKAVRAAFHAGGVNKVQAQKFLSTLMPELKARGEAMTKAQATAQAKKDQEFDALAKTMLGEQNKPTMERVRKLIGEHAPAAAKGLLDKLDDNHLVLMAAVIDAIHKKYAPEDDLKGSGKGGASSGSAGGPKEKRARAMELMKSKAYLDPFHAEHESTVAEVNSIYKEVAAAGT